MVWILAGFITAFILEGIFRAISVDDGIEDDDYEDEEWEVKPKRRARGKA